MHICWAQESEWRFSPAWETELILNLKFLGFLWLLAALQSCGLCFPLQGASESLQRLLETCGAGREAVLRCTSPSGGCLGVKQLRVLTAAQLPWRHKAPWKKRERQRVLSVCTYTFAGGTGTACGSFYVFVRSPTGSPRAVASAWGTGARSLLGGWSSAASRSPGSWAQPRRGRLFPSLRRSVGLKGWHRSGWGAIRLLLLPAPC